MQTWPTNCPKCLKLGQVAKSLTESLDLDSELVSYLNSIKRCNSKAWERRALSESPCVSIGGCLIDDDSLMPLPWRASWQSGYLKSSAARSEVPDNCARHGQNGDSREQAALQTPRTATEWARAGCYVLILIATQSSNPSISKRMPYQSNRKEVVFRALLTALLSLLGRFHSLPPSSQVLDLPGHCWLYFHSSTWKVWIPS